MADNSSISFTRHSRYLRFENPTLNQDSVFPWTNGVFLKLSSNNLPTISGTPSPLTLTVGDSFDFTPTVNDADGDPLTLSVSVNDVAGIDSYSWLI